MSTKVTEAVRVLALVLAVILLAYSAQAQRKHGKGAGKAVSVTGCLQKGEEPDEYRITGTDGKTYGLRSTTVKLADHLGHKVTVTGARMKETSEHEKKEKKEGKAEYADLNVTDLKMISTTCP